MKYEQMIIILLFVILLYIILKDRQNENFETEHFQTGNDYLDNPNDNPNVRGLTVTDIKSDKFSIKFHAPKGYISRGNGKYIVDTSNYGGRSNLYKFQLEVESFLVVVGIYSDRTGKNLLRTNTYNIYPNECKPSGPYDVIEYDEEICTRTIVLTDLDKLINELKVDDSIPTLYVKVGVIAMYKHNNNSIIKDLYGMPVLPNNPSIMANKGLFPLKQFNINLDDSDYIEFEKFKRQRELDRQLESSDDGGEPCIGADGNMDFIKANLGGYPDNLFLQERTGDKSLKELMKRQLSLGILNVNVHTQGM